MRLTCLAPLLGACALLATRAATANSTAQSLPFTEDWSPINRLDDIDDWSALPGIIGYLGDTLTGATGTDPQSIVADGSATPMSLYPNQINTNLSLGGVTEFHLANPLVALQASATARAPHLVIHLDTRSVTAVKVEYDLHDIDASADNAIQPIALQYRVGDSGDYTNVPTAFVADATAGPNLAGQVTHVAAVLPLTAAGRMRVELRILAADADGADEWVGIDNISIAQGPTPLVPLGSATPALAQRGDSVQLVVAVTPGTFPDSTLISVTCDLTALGGPAAATLFDDGGHGDGAAGDLTFGRGLTVPLDSAFGVNLLDCLVADAEDRAAALTLTVEVVPICGDGIREGPETCDDGDAQSGDGCSARCLTESGWSCTGLPSVCSDINECAGSPCASAATCTNSIGSFTCTCASGYTGDGLSAGSGCADLNECQTQTDNCAADATCVNTPGSFSCACNLGFGGDGVSCTAICGDGLVVGLEPCDDANGVAGDGCANCTLEDGFACLGEPSACSRDQDGDGTADETDNCPTTANPNQADSDLDGRGDVCDPEPETPGGGEGCGCGAGARRSWPWAVVLLPGWRRARRRIGKR